MTDPRMWLALLCLGGCNAVSGINDYSTPTCEDCERKECTAEFSACRADMRCANLTMCVERCSSPECVQGCQQVSVGPEGGAPAEGGPPPLGGGADGGEAAELMACAQTRCPVCTAH